MRFLFVNLDWQGLVSKKTFKIHLRLPPLDLILLHNFARAQGHEAVIHDGFVSSGENLARQINDADWCVVTTTPYHMWQCPNSEWNWICQTLARFPKEKTVLVGLHPSIFAEKTLRETGVHAVIRREPEVVFREFLSGAAWRDCRGVSYLAGDELRENPAPPQISMNDLVVRDYAVDISRYGYFLLGSRTGVFEASRGCPWKCTFCDQEMFSWTHRDKDPELFAEEVARGVKQTGMKTAYFFDLEFTISRKRTLEICRELVKRGVPRHLSWACQTRADMVNEETLAALKSAGCKLIHFGVESADNDILHSINKRISVERIEHGVRLAKSKGFSTACFFMFGLPGETPRHFERTLEFARALNPTYASFHFAIPFPGTPLYQRYLTEHQLQWGVWPATYYTDWSHAEISRYIRRAYRRFYLTPKRMEPAELARRVGNLGAKVGYLADMLRL